MFTHVFAVTPSSMFTIPGPQLHSPMHSSPFLMLQLELQTLFFRVLYFLWLIRSSHEEERFSSDLLGIASSVTYSGFETRARFFRDKLCTAACPSFLSFSRMLAAAGLSGLVNPKSLLFPGWPATRFIIYSR